MPSCPEAPSPQQKATPLGVIPHAVHPVTLIAVNDRLTTVTVAVA
jgi:hypothetical protein